MLQNCQIFSLQRLLGTISIAVVASLFVTSSFAQSTSLEEIVVTGSYLKRTPEDSASPVRVIGSEELGAAGNATLDGISLTLASNVGSEAQPNIFRQNFNAGTAPLNLRGLGLGSTLVLINGRRMTFSSAYSQDGSSYVDINSIPSIMVENLEILKDGAAALYGSDAVAGVANFVTHRSYEGAKVSASFASAGGDQDDIEIGILFGRSIGDTDFAIGINYLDRDPLSTTDRAFTDGTGFSAAGQPGNFIIPGGPPVPDPACATSGGINGPPPLGLCLFDFIPFAQLVIPETRLQAMATITHSVSENTELYGEILLSRNEVEGQTLPGSLPSVTGGAPAIPATHPNNPFGQDIVLAIFRPFGANAPAGLVNRENDTNRFVVGARGDRGEWSWDVGLQHSSNDYFYNFPDVKVSRLAAALRGEAGPANNEFFNPFGTASGNSQGVIDDISANQTRDGSSSLTTLDFVATSELGSIGSSAPVGIAIGAQYRTEDLEATYDAETQNFDLAFLVGSTNFDADRSAYAAFIELSIPWSDNFEMQLAGRYENYEDFGGSFDPKLAARWTPSDNVVLRGSVSTAFRVASLHQAFGNQAAVAEFQGPTGPIFRGDLTSGNVSLGNEESVSFNLGVVFNPTDNLTMSVDYWRYDYEDVITKEDAVTIFNDWTASGSLCTDMRIIVTDRTGAISCANRFRATNTRFINAGESTTDGIDLTLDYAADTAVGTVGLQFDATRILSFDITPTPGSSEIDVLGSRNFFNYARTTQEWRGTLRGLWSSGNHSANITGHYIDGFINDQVAIGASPASVGSHTTWDIQYSYDFESSGFNATIGAINVFDRDPPPVSTFFGFESQTHDPRGQIAYLRLSKSFDFGS